MRRDLDFECRAMGIEEARSLAPIPSGYETDRVFRLREQQSGQTLTWTLFEETLSRPLRKQYDGGRLEDWLPSYQETTDPAKLRFLAAFSQGRVQGLLTWQQLSWNNTTWLVDIRVRAEMRGRRVGSALVERLKESSRQLGVRGISVETQITNYPAVRFYQKHGFRIAGFNHHLYSNRDLERQEVALFLFCDS